MPCSRIDIVGLAGLIAVIDVIRLISLIGGMDPKALVGLRWQHQSQ